MGQAMHMQDMHMCVWLQDCLAMEIRGWQLPAIAGKAICQWQLPEIGVVSAFFFPRQGA